MTKVLLVEDDATMRNLLKTLLEIEKFEVVIADMGQPALDEIRKANPDAILMDVHLQRENGMDVVKALRKFPAGKRIKVLMASGMDLKHECIDAGADGFLMKPYMPDELINWLKQSV